MSDPLLLAAGQLGRQAVELVAFDDAGDGMADEEFRLVAVELERDRGALARAVIDLGRRAETLVGFVVRDLPDLEAEHRVDEHAGPGLRRDFRPHEQQFDR